jgi:FlaA1/EpsC-like NDP-sugar epimerase
VGLTAFSGPQWLCGPARRLHPCATHSAGAVLVAFSASDLGFRYISRWLILEFTQEQTHRRNIMIYGAGDAGRQIAATLKQSSNRISIFQVDDDATHVGRDDRRGQDQ